MLAYIKNIQRMYIVEYEKYTNVLNLRYFWKIFKHKSKQKVGDSNRGWPEGSLFDSYYTKLLGRALLLL